MNHRQAAFTIMPPVYVLFPFADPFDYGEMWSTPRFPSLLAPPGFAPIGQPGSLPGPAGIALCDWSSFIWPESPLQLRQSPPGWARPVILDTGFGDDQLPLVLSPIAHDSSVDPFVTGVAVSMTPVALDDDTCHLESLLDRLFPWSRSHTSVQSDSTFYSVADSPPGQAPVLRLTPILDRRLGLEGPFVAKNLHPRIGDCFLMHHVPQIAFCPSIGGV